MTPSCPFQSKTHKNIYRIGKLTSFSGSFYFQILEALVNHQAIVSKEKLQDKDQNLKGQPVIMQLRDFLQYSGSLASKTYMVGLFVGAWVGKAFPFCVQSSLSI